MVCKHDGGRGDEATIMVGEEANGKFGYDGGRERWRRGQGRGKERRRTHVARR